MRHHIPLLSLVFLSFLAATAEARNATITVLKCEKSPNPGQYYEHEKGVKIEGLLHSFEVTVTVDLDNQDPSGVILIEGKGKLTSQGYKGPLFLNYPKGRLVSGYQQRLQGISLQPSYSVGQNPFIYGENNFKRDASQSWVSAIGHEFVTGGADFKIAFAHQKDTPIFLASGCKWNFSYNGDNYFLGSYVFDNTKDD